MNATARAQLIRERYFAKRGAVDWHPLKSRLPGTEPTRRGWRNWPTNYAPTGEIAAGNDVRWVEVPDSRPKVTPRTNRQEGVAALARIAEQLPRKRQRVNWENQKSPWAGAVE